MQSLQNHITINYLTPSAMQPSTVNRPFVQECTKPSKNETDPGFMSIESLNNFKQVTISLDEIQHFSIKDLEKFLLSIAKVRGEMLGNEQNSQCQLTNRLYTMAKAVAALIAERKSAQTHIAA